LARSGIETGAAIARVDRRELLAVAILARLLLETLHLALERLDPLLVGRAAARALACQVLRDAVHRLQDRLLLAVVARADGARSLDRHVLQHGRQTGGAHLFIDATRAKDDLPGKERSDAPLYKEKLHPVLQGVLDHSLLERL